MYDIKELEDKWKKYKSKQRKPLFISVLLFVCLLLIFLSVNKSEISFSLIEKSLNDLTIKTDSFDNKNKKDNLLNGGLVSLETKVTYSKKKVKFDNILVDIPILSLSEEKKDVAKDKAIRKRVHLNIVGTSSISAYEDVEKRFLQSHDIDDALFLARSYYKRLDYDKALYWAFEVNKIDESLEECVLIFIDSKVKLGQKNEAIVLLKNYINKSASEAGKVLLDKIENDNFL